MIIDITRPLNSALAPWPGDSAFSFRLNWKMSAGASVNVGAFEMSTHNGSHADAPSHFLTEGATIDTLDPAVFVGPVAVVDATRHSAISQATLQPTADIIRECRRLLLKTDAWTDASVFPASIPLMTPELPAWLGELGVMLVGMDVPSVDAIDSKDLPTHHALARAHIAILESLDLTRVAAGKYELIAAPLKIEGGDASPIRALLRCLKEEA